MSTQNVSGTRFGIVAAVPTINAGDTDAQILTAYQQLAPYTTQDDCIITGLPLATRDWTMGTAPTTVCSNQDTTAIQQQFKIQRTSPNGTITSLMDYDDPFIQIMAQLQASDTAVGTYQTIHPLLQEIYGLIQVKSISVDLTDNESKVLFSSEVVYNAWPVFSDL